MSNNISISPIGSRISKWGEGPIFWNNHLLYVDIEGHALVRLDPESGAEEVWEMGERIGTVVPAQDDQFICAGDSGIYSFDPKTGKKVNLADPEANKRPDNRFNDGKCDPSGRFWAGTISTIKKTGDANLYKLGLDGSLSLEVPSVTNSNGICWNKDATVMYYIDTPTKKIVSYPFNNNEGSIGQPSMVVDFGALELEGSPDGMTIDSDDMLWVVLCHGGVVLKVDPGTGKVLQKVELPCVETTACSFGGENMDRLFVTTGVHKTRVEQNAGKVFVVDGLEARGVAAFAYAG